jgi:hypothetical protein
MISIRDQTYKIRSMADYQPSEKCYNPQRIVNKYTHEVLYVECRKCPYCLHKYATDLTSRIVRECKQHKYSLFFTLTYDNEHLPVMVRQCDHVWKLENRDEKRDGSVRSRYLFFDKTPDYQYPQKMSTDCFAVVCKEDVQRFLKRLRSKIDYDYDLSQEQKTLRYFICSEYGPCTKRPHYHGILWTDDPTICRDLPRLIRSAWTLCSPTRIDAQLVSGSAPEYVAKYVAGNSNLCEVLRFKYTKPFHLASKNPIIGSFKTTREEILDVLVNRYFEVPRIQDGNIEEASYDLLPYSFITRYFPSCQGFSFSDDTYQLSLYEKYREGRYLKRIDPETHRYVDCKLKGYCYLDSSTSFKYQDYRFFQHIHSLAYKRTVIPKRNSSGYIVGSIEVCLSPREIIHLIKMLYDSYKLYCYNIMLRNLEVVSDYLKGLNVNKYRVLSFYPLVWKELPLCCHEVDFYTRPFVSSLSLYNVLKQFGFEYDDVFEDGFISQRFVDVMNNNILDKNFRSHLQDTILKNDKKKKYSELYLGFNHV